MDPFWTSLSIYEISGYSIRSLTKEDRDEIFEFLQENSDYFLLENGRLPRDTDGQTFVTDLPPNKQPSDKFAISVDLDHRIAALVEIVRDYPEEHIWWIGLLLIHPSYRGIGLGGRICRLLEQLVCLMRGKEIRLGVLAKNIPGHHFWKRMGFTHIQTKHGMVIGEKTHTVHVMAKLLEQSASQKELTF